MRILIVPSSEFPEKDALRRIAREFAALGHGVFAFDSLPSYGKFEGVDYLPLEAFAPLSTHLDHDVLISWGSPMPLSGLTRSAARVAVLWNADHPLGLRASMIHRYFVADSALADELVRRYPEVSPHHPVAGLNDFASPRIDWPKRASAWLRELEACLDKRGQPEPRFERVFTHAFQGKSFRVVRNEEFASWHSFNDESDVRDAFWKIEPEQVVFDIGAAFGSYTLPALALGASRVYSWSPEHDGEMLARNVRENGLSDRCEILDFGLYHRDGYINPLSLEFTDHPKANSFRVTTLDRFVEEKRISRLDWMKLDVEGAELDVLLGGEETIRRFKPRIMVENHVFKIRTIDEDVRHFLESRSYRHVGTIPYHAVSHSLYEPIPTHME